MGRNENVAIFQDTEKMCRENDRLRESNADEVVILGAFGCGAFQNKPEIVARAAANVINDYLYMFKNIEFAVYCSPKDSRNYDAFKRELARIANQR
ncbi:hypothetical protein [Butyrivibrio sp. FC2001]|uniref:hypothetical protein n=1 Tax=Butyrivibrio sp. FC2001 TaxID=1280671 RepID=UPI0004290578|nr:hypothetical protein [Butyrivibrio sp. FC2001]